MTQENFLQLVKSPLSVTAENLSDLNEVITYYPFFSHAQLLYAKSLLFSGNVRAEKHMQRAVLYCRDKHWFYYFLHPEKKPLGENVHHERIARFTGSYFDLLENAGSNEEEINVSLKNLAERLKQARQMVQYLPTKPSESTNNAKLKTTKVTLSVPDYFENKKKNEEITEDLVKKYIKEGKYEAAIEILKKLNLINPKKSIYFADQIRFLEKVIANQKK